MQCILGRCEDSFKEKNILGLSAPPMPPVTALDEPWSFFHFWRHHFWPKLASSILNFCRRKRSVQWCPDQSDRPKGAWDMHKNAQKVEQKTQTKISCHYTWLFHGKNCPSRWRVLRERSLTIGPFHVNSPKILAPFKMWAQKIVTLPCKKKMIFYERYFKTIISLE